MPREQRRLAAIVAADVAGYSRLMGRDESGTLAALKALRRELIDPRIDAHGGRIVKSTGDGLLLEFASAVDAVRCVLDIQATMATHNAAIPADRRIEFRVGVNIGDIIIDNGDIFGDGVNVAARLQEIAAPGGIYLSGAAQQQVQGKVEGEFTDLGEHRVKNIASPVRVFTARIGVLPTAGPTGMAGGAPLALPDKPSIAVLPFANLSGDAAQEYFADGVVEDIISALSHVRWLFVIARNSSFTYKGRAVDVKQVGRDLGVRYVLEGSIRKAANRVRIAGQLIEAVSGANLWADRFDGSLDDIFDLQDQVTSSIVGVLMPKLELAEIERARRKPTDNLDAYDYYLRGVASLRAGSSARVDEALSLFTRAIERDPTFAAAYGQAATCYVARKAHRWVKNRQEEMTEAGRLARRAWELDRDDAVAIGNAGYALAYVVHDLDAGTAYVERALALNSNLALNWAFSAGINVWLGRGDVAIEHAMRAMRLSPLDPLTYMMQLAIAQTHYFAGRYDEATSWADAVLRERPGFFPPLLLGAASAAMADRPAQATRLGQELQRVDPALRLSTLREALGPYRNPEDVARYTEGLRRAGIPE